METELIARFADFLETVKDEQFYFPAIVKNWNEETKCGTICCAAGHLPNFDSKMWYWYKGHFSIRVGKVSSSKFDLFEQIAEYFDISYQEVEGIFFNETPEGRNDNYSDDDSFFYKKSNYGVTRIDVINALRELIK